MKRAQLPANIEIMQLNPRDTQAMKPVKVLDLFDGGTTNFHEDGLFSISIFGRVGSDERDSRFSYIDLHTEVFHPFIYYTLCQLKGLYKGIMAKKAYAVWDEKEKDFVPSDAVYGETGYAFFVKHWKDIKFKESGSAIREFRIKLIEKYREQALTSKVLVLPAGLRDVEIDEGGRIRQGEINDFYRSILSISNAINTNNVGSTRVIDSSRISLQLAFCRVFDYLEMLISGKGGFIQHRFASRKIFNGTRNVITSMDTSVEVLGQPNSPKVNNTVMGLHQTLKAVLPYAFHAILTGWISKVFNGAEGSAVLVNPSSRHREIIQLPHDIIDLWTTTTGIEKLINHFDDVSLRSKPIKVKDYYIGLVYRGPDMTFRFFNEIDELPPDRSKDDVYPITLGELFYVSGYKIWNDVPEYVTRYPVTNMGSIYPSFNYVKTTTVGEMRVELGEDWKPIREDASDYSHVALEYPKADVDSWVDSLSPHPSRYTGLEADHDGDMCSSNALYTTEAIEETRAYLNKADAYKAPGGGLKASPITDTIERAMINMSGDI